MARETAVRHEARSRLWRTALLAFLVLASGLLGPSPALAQTLFGPKVYTQTTTSPQTFGATFFLPASVPPPYALSLENGQPDGSARVLHGSVFLNGVEVIAPRELGAEVVLLDKPVSLKGTNVLALTLSGPVGGTLTLKVEARAPALTSVTPGTGTQGTTLTVAVVGTNTHFLPGVTQATFGPGIGVGGAPPGALGPVTVTDATHFTADLTIASSTFLGRRTVIAKTNGETASLLHGFAILPSTPALAGTTVSTLAGTGVPGLTDGPGASAQFAFPADVAVSGTGTVAVADTGNSRLRRIAPDAPATVSTSPVGLLLPAGVASGASGQVVVADTARCVIRLVNPDDTVALTVGSPGACGFADGSPGTARFKFPRDVVADATGTLYVADTGNFQVRKIDAQGNVTTLAGSGAFGGADGPATTATFGLLSGIAVAKEPDGTVFVFVTDAVFHRIRRIAIAPDGTVSVSTLAGTGTAGFADGPLASAQFFFPTGLSRDQAGNLDIADTGNNLIRRLTPQDEVVTLAGTGLPGSADGTGPTASFHLPLGLAGDSKGRVFLADTANHTIRVLQVAPVISAISPTSAVHGRPAFPFTVTGTNLLGATALTFLRDGAPDSALTATDLVVNADGTTLTATVAIAATAALGRRTVTVTTPGGTSAATPEKPATTFTVLGQLSLVPAFQELAVGATGSLTVSLSAPAPTGGLPVTLTSANPAFATVTSPVTIAAGATTGTATVTAVSEGSTNLTASAPGFADGQAAVTVISPPPSITGFTPTSGKVGTTVTISGTGFRPTASQNTVSFTGPNNTRVPAPVSAATATSLTVAVPADAVTGPIQVTTPSGTATSPGHFVVLPTEDFTLSAVPGTGTVVAGDQVSFHLSAAGEGGFTGVIALGVGTLPPGITATLSPGQLGPGGASTLTVRVSGTVGAGSASIPLTGTATLNGQLTSRSLALPLSILAVTTTAFVGRVLNTADEPLANVKVTLLDAQDRATPTTTTTDAGGNFVLPNVPGGNQMFFVDGRQAKASPTDPRTYPPVEAVLDILANQANRVPFIIYLPPIDTAAVTATPPNNPSPIIATSPSIPDLEVVIPPNTTITLTEPDGTTRTVSEITLTAVPVDRAPMPLPPGFTTPFLLTIQPGGAVPQNAQGGVVVRFPTWGQGIPGQRASLFFFDFTLRDWRIYGQGTVSPDGRQILPDPGVVQPRFAWHGATLAPPPPNTVPNLTITPSGVEDLGVTDPVDPVTGFFTLSKTDLVLPGRLPLALTRTYRSGDTLMGPFGIGGRHAYDAFLVFPTPSATDQLVLVLPDLKRYAFPRQPDGTFRNPTDPAMQGALVTLSGGTRLLTFKDRTLWTFDGNGRLIAQQDRTGNTLTITRDGQGRVTTLTEPAGRQLLFTYSGTGLQVSSVTDPLGREVRYSYDASGRLATVTDPAEGITRYTYDAQGRMATITDPRNIPFLTNEYDARGRVCRQTQADGGVWLLYYVPSDAAGTGAAQQLLAEAAAGGPLSTPPCTVLGTAPTILATVVVDPRGHPTTHRFNSSGYLLAQTDALGQVTRFERPNGSNLLLATTDPLGRVTRFSYDAAGNVTSITDPQGNTRSFTYDPTFNKVTSITDPLGNVTTFEYDTHGNLVALTDPEQNRKPEAQRLKTQIAYNAFGQPVTTTDPLGNMTTFEYDAVGNLTRISDPLGNTTTRQYDSVSRLLTQTDPRGKITLFAYDPLNRVTQITDALSGLTAFSYDGNGNLLTVTDARSSVTTHTYDPMDRLATRTDPLGRQETFSYDPVGNLVSTTDRKLHTSMFAYDPLNRRVRSTFADGAVATSTYDAAGRLVLADDSADPHRPIALEYDALDRLLAETTSLGTVSYRYDTAGRRTQMTVGGQPPVAYAYDAASRLTQVVQEPLGPVTISYDPLGRRTLLSLPNQVSTEYQYDPASRLSGLIYRNALGPLGDLTYTYDAAGKRIGVGGTFARTLLPDPIPSAAYDAANQQLQFGPKTMTFDANGNLASLTDPTGSTTLTWDVRNRLTSIAGPALTASLMYDALNRRVSKVINGQASRYVYDRTDIIHQLDNQGATNYLRSLQVDETLALTSSDGAHFLIKEALGSTLLLADHTGSPLIQYTYGPFGHVSVTGPDFPNPFRYTGREQDSNDFFFYRARYYHPGLSRFVSEDPIRHRGGLNLYAYVLNSPINYVDPFGLKLDLARAGRLRLAFEVVDNTAKGGEIIGRLRRDSRTYKIIEGRNGQAHWDPINREIVIDPDIRPLIETRHGLAVASIWRILAHELGHAGPEGRDDSGPDRMDNVNANENPVARELGEPERTAYFFYSSGAGP